MFVQESKMKYEELIGLQNVLYKWVVKNQGRNVNVGVFKLSKQHVLSDRQTDRQNRIFDSNVHNDIFENDKIKQYKVYND